MMKRLDPFSLEGRLSRVETAIRTLTDRIDKLEEFAGINNYGATGGTDLHSRIEYLEDWRRDVYTET